MVPIESNLETTALSESGSSGRWLYAFAACFAWANSRFHLAPDLEGLEARLARSGYDVKQLTAILTAKPKEIRAFLSGHLPPERTQEHHDQLLAAGIPLGP